MQRPLRLLLVALAMEAGTASARDVTEQLRVSTAGVEINDLKEDVATAASGNAMAFLIGDQPRPDRR